MTKFNRTQFLLDLNKAKRLSTKEFIERAKELYGDKFDYSKTEYITARQKVIITCPEHGDFEILPQHHLKGKSSGGCRKCGIEEINKDRKLTQEQFIERIKDIQGLSFEKTVYSDKRKKVIVTCKIHGDYKTTAEVLLKGCGCPKCKSSLGENLIEKILKEKNIIYEHQRTFEGLSYKRRLAFDFYLPFYHACIEFDGEQHYRPIKYWKGEKGFEELQIKDNMKNVFCQKNNIPLLRVRYDSQNIEKEVLDFINTLNKF